MTHIKLKSKDVLTIEDLSGQEIIAIFRVAEELRALSAGHGFVIESHLGEEKRTAFVHPQVYSEFLAEKVVSLIFSLPSTRTKAAAELAVIQSGGHPMMFAGMNTQLSRGESAEDTIKCLEYGTSAFIIREEDHEWIKHAAKATAHPVINALSRQSHPVEALAEFLTLNHMIYSRSNQQAARPTFSFDGLQQLKCAYIGDTANVALSLMWTAHKLKIPFTIASPEEFSCPPELRKQLASSTVKFTEDPVEAASGANAIFGDTYVSMGHENERDKRETLFKPYQVNKELFQHTAPDCLYLHCLPAYRGQEVTAEIIDGKNSIVFQIAQGRVLIYRALLTLLLGSKAS